MVFSAQSCAGPEFGPKEPARRFQRQFELKKVRLVEANIRLKGLKTSHHKAETEAAAWSPPKQKLFNLIPFSCL